MLSLPELQARFAAHLFADDPAAIIPWVRADGIEPTARLRIYRNNLHEGFLKTLTLEYPVIARLVGPEYFRQLALAFLTCHPSGSGDLHHIGAPFAAYLEQQFGDSSYRYLADVAALEWAYQECQIAEYSTPLDPQILRSVPAASYGSLRFALRRTCRLVQSQFPILMIWEANQGEAPGEAISLDAGPDFLLVLRSHLGIHFRRMPSDDYLLLSAFAAGRSLDEALELGLAANQQFDLSAALRRCVEYGALSEVVLSPNVP